MPSQNDQWKLDMLRRLLGGAEDDPGKDGRKSPSGKGAGGGRSKAWPSIDLHRFSDVETQLAATEKAVDEAICGGFGGIVIIHGKGEGILRARVVEALSRHPHVVSCKSIKDDDGKSGALRVRFR